MGFLPLHRSSHIAVSFVKSSVKKVQTINRPSFFSLITSLPFRSSIYLTAFHVSSSLDRVLIGFCFNLRQTFVHMLFFLLLVLGWCLCMLAPFLRGLPASLLNCEILSCFSVKSRPFAFPSGFSCVWLCHLTMESEIQFEPRLCPLSAEHSMIHFCS